MSAPRSPIGGRRAALIRGRKHLAAMTDYERTRLRTIARGVVGAVARGDVPTAERLISDYFASVRREPESRSDDAIKEHEPAAPHREESRGREA